MNKGLLFLAYCCAEVYLLIYIGGYIGALNTILWMFASAVLGVWCMRLPGQGGLNAMRQEMQTGKTPEATMLNTMLFFIAGLLLMLPGFLSDALGLLLLIPPVRHLCAKRLLRRMASGTDGMSFWGNGNFFYMNSRVVYPPRQNQNANPHTVVLDCEPEREAAATKDDAASTTYTCTDYTVTGEPEDNAKKHSNP